jgi:hypothetical protein
MLIATAAGLLTLGVALPASAALSGATTASVTVDAGTLAITVPLAAGSLGSRAFSAASGVISGPLGQVQVTDGRSIAVGPGWVVSVISTAFTPPSGTTIPASAIGYTTGTVTALGTVALVAANPTTLEGQSVVLTATAVTGANSATWNPTINVTVPGNTAPNTYTAVGITHSVI